MLEWGYVQYVEQSLQSAEHSPFDVPSSFCRSYPHSIYFIVTLTEELHYTTIQQ